jgi:HlyD family secretion protein
MDPRKRRRIVGRVITSSVALAAVALIAYGFVPSPVPVVVGSVKKQSLEVTVDESGKTRLRSRYIVSSPVLGSLSRITLKPGDAVKEGDLLAQISPMTPQLLDDRTRNEAGARVSMSQANFERSKVTIKRAEAALNFAKDQAERLRSLKASQGTSQQSLDQAEFELRAAEEDFAAARFAERVANHELSMSRAAVQSIEGGPAGGPGLSLTAPITGHVLRVYQESEGVVQPGTPLVEIGDLSSLEIVVDVLTTDAVLIEPGAEAHVERWGGEGTLKARVRKKEPSAFTTRSALGVEEQRVPVVLDLVDPREKWAALGDGYRVETRIRTALVPDAVVAPGGAVFRDGKDWAVFAVREGRARKLKIDVGSRTPDLVQVKAGVKTGEQVVLYPSDQVREDIQVSASTAGES